MGAAFGTVLPCLDLYPGTVTLLADLERIATAAAAHAPDGGAVTAVLAAEPTPGVRAYLCAFEAADGARSWLVLDDDGARSSSGGTCGTPSAIAALCEIAEESAVGGDLDELLSQLVALRLTESPEGIDEAEDAVRALQQTIGRRRSSPRRRGSTRSARRPGGSSRRSTRRRRRRSRPR